MNNDNKVIIHNKFEIEVIDSRTNEIKQKARAFNVVLDKLFEQHITQAWFRTIVIGEGEGVPSSSDQGLFKPIHYAEMSNIKSRTDIVEQYKSKTGEILINETQLNGKKLTEIGVSTWDYNGVCTHAMLKDMNGNQIAIDKTEFDRIKIYATVYAHIQYDPKGLIPFGGMDGNVIPTYCTLLDMFSGSGLGSAYASISGCAGTFSVNTQLVLDKPTKTFKRTLSRVGLSTGNYPGGLLYLSTGDCAGWLYDDWYKATPIVGEAMGTGDGTKTRFATKFYGCKDAKVYIDGVRTTDVTVYDKKPATFTHATHNPGAVFFKRLSKEGIPRPLGMYYSSGLGFSNGTKDAYDIYENMLYGIVDLTEVTTDSSFSVYGSNDMTTWTHVPDKRGMRPNDQYRYYKIVTLESFWNSTTFIHPIQYKQSNYNVEFNNPPPDGAVITIDYTPRCMAKDEKHLLDIEVSGYQYGPWTGGN